MDKEIPGKFVDTLNYGEKDYDSMRNYFNSDTSFLTILNKQIALGDTNAMKIKDLLHTSYNSRSDTRVTEADIDAMIFSFYASKTLIEKFNDIDKTLPYVGVEDVKHQTDSIINSIERLKKDLKEN